MRWLLHPRVALGLHHAHIRQDLRDPALLGLWMLLLCLMLIAADVPFLQLRAA